MPDIEQAGSDNPYAPPGAGTDGRQEVEHDPLRARRMVTQGIVGAVFLSIFPLVSLILGLINWSRAGSDLKLMVQGLMSTEDGARGKTKAGLILAKINTIVSPFALISLVLYFWLLAESGF